MNEKRFIAICLCCILLTSCLCNVVIAEDALQKPDGLVLDANGILWYMPEQIPLTFLTEEERTLLMDAKRYTTVSYELSDERSNSEIIWDYWYYKTGNTYGVAGLMGNIESESGFNPMNLQGSFETATRTDESYTKSVDDGIYQHFVTDEAGYGLVQWTNSTYKEQLFAFAQKRGTSIGDIYMQLDYMYQDFRDNHPIVFDKINSADDILISSNAILLGFECPADQSEGAQIKRANRGSRQYDKHINRCIQIDAIKDIIINELNESMAIKMMLQMHYEINAMQMDIKSEIETQSLKFIQ